MRDVSCVLLSKSYIKDENGNIVLENGREKYEIAKREVPIIDVGNVWKDEFYKGNAQGLRPSIRLELSILNYENEETLIYMNNEYTIIRVDDTDSLDTIALVCEKRSNNVK